jgi:hypothetical protein
MSFSYCFILGCLPILSVQTQTRNNRFLIGTALTNQDDEEHLATLFAYMESPPQQQALFELEASPANNSGSDITLGSAFREMELLGNVSLSGNSVTTHFRLQY